MEPVREGAFQTFFHGKVLQRVFTAALAVGWVSKIGEMYNMNDNTERQELLKYIQQLNDGYEGNAVRCVLTEALYDSASGSYGLGWSLEPLKDGDKLYVVLDGITIGGERTHTRNEMHVTEYLLDKKTEINRSLRWLRTKSMIINLLNFGINAWDKKL